MVRVMGKIGVGHETICVKLNYGMQQTPDEGNRLCAPFIARSIPTLVW